MEFELGQKITREQLGQAFMFVNKYNETHDIKWDVVATGMYSWEIVLATVPTEKQVKENRIIELKKFLADTDYIVIKMAEGCVVENCESVIEQRRAARAEINTLQGE